MIPRRFTPGAVGDPLPPPQQVPSPAAPVLTHNPDKVPIEALPLIEERQTHVVGPAPAPNAAAAILQQLAQLTRATPDAAVARKDIADNLVSKGLAVRSSGYTIATGKGISYLVDLGML